MNPAEWFSFVGGNEEYIVEHLKGYLPDAELSSVLPGLPPTVYLRHKHGVIELTFGAVQLELDTEKKIAGIHHLIADKNAIKQK